LRRESDRAAVTVDWVRVILPPVANEPPARWWTRRRLVGWSLAVVGAFVTALVTGIAGKVFDVIWQGGGSPTRNTSEIARFDGIAGHLAEARALLDFLDQHDDDIVYLEVGFPKLSPAGPISAITWSQRMCRTKEGARSRLERSV
jgi:hypothetical protein